MPDAETAVRAYNGIRTPRPAAQRARRELAVLVRRGLGPGQLADGDLPQLPAGGDGARSSPTSTHFCRGHAAGLRRRRDRRLHPHLVGRPHPSQPRDDRGPRRRHPVRPAARGGARGARPLPDPGRGRARPGATSRPARRSPSRASRRPATASTRSCSTARAEPVPARELAQGVPRAGRRPSRASSDCEARARAGRDDPRADGCGADLQRRVHAESGMDGLLSFLCTETARLD